MKMLFGLALGAVLLGISGAQAASMVIGPAGENSFQFFSGPGAKYGHQLTLGPDGNVWFRATQTSRLGFITPSGGVTEFPLPTGHGKPFGIAAGPDGAIWFTDINGYAIGRMTLTGSVTMYPMRSNNTPYDITKGSDGNLWFTAVNRTTLKSSIGKITPTGAITLYPVLSPNTRIVDITLGPDGNVWYANNGARAIGRVRPSGLITEFTTPTGAWPQGIVAAADGNLYASLADRQATLLKITTSGQMSLIPDPKNARFFNTIARGPDGNVWGERPCTLDPTNNCLARYNVHLGGFVEYETAVPGLAGLVAGSDGNLWVQVSMLNDPTGLGVFYL